MARTTRLNLELIGDWNNVSRALLKASRGKRHRPDVGKALGNVEVTINRVATALRKGEMPLGEFHSFNIADPKRRVIHAAPFLDRIAHHAIVQHLEPTLEGVLLPSVFACRRGKGVHAAIAYAQRQARRYNWVMHIDIAQYFPSIDHQNLRQQLQRRFRGDGLRLLDAVIDSHQRQTGKGLPIGALTSQYFANHYLNEADRWCLAQAGINAHCRYMDDFLLWSDDPGSLRAVRDQLADFLQQRLSLNMKPALIQRSQIGLLFCGIRIKPFSLRASIRRRRRYRHVLEYWQRQWCNGTIDSLQLQRSYDAIQAMLMPSDELQWRRQCLKVVGEADA